MTRAVVSCGPFDSLLEAARTMGGEDVGCLPVVAGDGTRRLIGVLTDRDVSMAAANEESSIGELRVRSAMTVPAITCAPEDELGDVLERMAHVGVRRMPVVDAEHRMLGLISLSDVAAVLSTGGAEAVSGTTALCRALARSVRHGPIRSGGTAGSRERARI